MTEQGIIPGVDKRRLPTLRRESGAALPLLPRGVIRAPNFNKWLRLRFQYKLWRLTD